ncbi:MAG: RNA polymerase sigma factor [Sandaracinus sp.]|nr:RNA polymerase sigma factor [Myxococcales bacterium]MCB9621538.1 RNA polymerase sigma factor [Sandaracinus sp.]MCB9631225.1 RNA polymerase sigma factor [Sandaracinus sp.]
MSRFDRVEAPTDMTTLVARVRPPEVARLPRSSACDDELVARALGGDRWAEEALYRRHVHRVTTVVARLLRHGPDVEDVVQDTFVEALRDLGKLREPSRVGPWLVRIAVHRVHKVFRRRRLLRALGLERSMQDEPLELQAKVDASSEARAELALLDRALDAMSFDDRTAWVLVALEDYPLAEAASLARCSLATLKRRVARAERAIAEHFEEVRHA